MFDHQFLISKYCLENMEKISLRSWGWGFGERRSGFSNFLRNLSKTFVSADFVVIRILPLLPAGEIYLFAPENFKVLFRHDQLVIAY